MDDLRLAGEFIQTPGNPIVEAHTNGNQHVALLHSQVRGGLAVHATHAQSQWMRFVDIADPQKRGDHRDFGLLDQFHQLSLCAANLHTVARQNQRPLGLVDQARGLLDRLWGGTTRARHAGKEDLLRVFELNRGVLHIFADIHQHRPRAPLARNVERLAHDTREFAHIGDQIVVLGHRLSHAGHIGFLKSITAEQARRHLAGDGHQRYRIQQRGSKPSHQVGGRGARGRHADADPPCGPGVPIRHVRCALLVTHEDMAHGILHHRVIDRQVGAARITENDFHPFTHHDFPHHLGAAQFHRSLLHVDNEC